MSAAQDIGRLVVAKGLLDESGLRRILQGTQMTTRDFLGRLLEARVVDEPELVSLVAEHLGIPAIDLSLTSIHLEALDLIPRAVAEADLLLPLSTEGGRLHVAVNGASYAQETLDELKFITGLLVSPYAALPWKLTEVIVSAYDARERGEAEWRGEAFAPGAGSGLAVVLPGDGGAPTEEVYSNTDEIEALAFEVSQDEQPTEGEEVVHSAKVRVGPARILVVDDELEIARMLEKALRAEGYAVDTALDGREAERKLHPRPDLVLLDAMLPHVHGFEICSRIKGSAKLRSVPVIMMSAVYRGWRFAQDAREAFGADDYVEKPFHLADVLRRVRDRLEHPRSRPPARKEEADRSYQEGLRLLGAGNASQGRAELAKAVAADPFSARNHFALGRALRSEGDAFRAMGAYEKAVELRPSHFAALCSLAELYLEKGFRRKAIEALERALSAAPDGSTREGIRSRLLRLL